MNREIKFRVWDEKYNQWDTSPLTINPAESVVKQGRVIQQFTGLKDKNGKEIYEGDIITGMHDYGPAGFNEAKATITFHVEEGYQLDYWNLKTVEVIGNIFENPELCAK